VKIETFYCDGCGDQIESPCTEKPEVTRMMGRPTDYCGKCIYHALIQYLEIRDRPLRRDCPDCKGTGTVASPHVAGPKECTTCKF
jgi:hypothetical protein